jgi:NaMN:DMB phosphoribosyltransferase
LSVVRKNLGLAALALLPIVCCVGIPLMVAAGVSIAFAAWMSGIAVGGIVIVTAAVVLVLRVRRRHGGRSPFVPITRSCS